MVRAMDHDALARALAGLPQQLAALDGVVARQREAAWLVYRDELNRRVAGLIGRLERADEPLLVVLAGGTGAGKSTLANTLAGAAVAVTSARRPTTSQPTAIGRSADLEAVLRRGVLAERKGEAAFPVQAAPVEEIPAGLVLVDAPDVDSVETANRDTAERLLEVADVWLWLATARTYADEAGMVYLRRAARLDAATVVVVTQISAAEAEEIVPDLEDKLHEAGHRQLEIHVIPRVEPHHQQLPATAVAGLLERIRGLAPLEQRTALRWQTVCGGVRALPGELDELLTALADDQARVQQLDETLEQVYGAVPERLLEQLQEAAPLRQEVLRRWSELVGEGWLQRQLSSAAEFFPRRLFARLPLFGRRGETLREEATAHARQSVAELIAQVLEQAASESEARWRELPGGRAVLDALGSPRSAGEVAQADAAEALVAAWEQQVAEHVATIGQRKLSRARRATTGINATVTSAAVVLFTLSGGLTLGEVALTAAGSTTTHTVLSRILGERNVNQLIVDIREDLRTRVAEQAAHDAARYQQRLQAAAPSAEQSAALRAYRDRLGELAS
ncbi:hypothetical protein CKO15_07400 [Halorhodospira abdelmalekii]|uniref:GTPase n=1 Tax=Halorhodospira abdelmalekii TaxID=421629 RepID=UPI001902D92E|nr:GTPase [Halorhodospira abdelmalekii]MBK1735113.1 hypothetical protein [Halorhodospira abdelmalekii]